MPAPRLALNSSYKLAGSRVSWSARWKFVGAEKNVMLTGTPEDKSAGLLAGKRVLVTGGSGGIGRGICEVLAREGARIAFTWNGNATNAAETESLVRKHGNEC